MHNYHDTYNTFPHAFILGIAFSGTTIDGVNHVQSWASAILPGIDQANLSNALIAAGGIARAPASLTSTVIPTFLCPTTPRGTNVGTITFPAGATFEGAQISQNLTLTSGLSDYICFETLTGQLDNLAYPPTSNPPGNNKDAAMHAYEFTGDTPIGQAMLSSGEDDNKIRSISDGTSNTILIAEYAGREKLYHNGKVVTGNFSWPAAGLACATEAQCVSQMLGANGWAFHTIGEARANGVNYSGPIDPINGEGPCAINCANPFYLGLEIAGMYSFHTGIAHALMADGSVRAVGQNIGMPVFGGLFTKAGGEVFSNE
jgi:hypothetical protein